MVNVPVLLIAFNRPETTTVVFEYIRRAKPTKLYVALDGSRKDKLYEDIVCNEVRNIVEKVDWECDVQYKINEQNMGAELTVSKAIDWVFETEEYAIILEDDIVVPIAFFKFAQEMLIKYKDYKCFSIVTSNNTTPIDLPNGEDYFFAKYGHSWGWATWKHTWEMFDLNVEINDKHTSLSFLREICNSEKEAKYYQQLFKKMKDRGVGNNTWDYIFLYLNRVANNLAIIPKVNLSSNIGVYGFHAQGKTDHHYKSFDEKFRIVNHPKKIECNVEFDKYHFDNHIYKKNPFYKRVMRKISKILIEYSNS